MTLGNFLKSYGYLVFYGFVLAFLSSFGQTFLISLYVPDIQAYFEVSDGLFSSFYAAATLGSAFTITWAGRFIDKKRLTRFTVIVMLGLAVALIVLSQAYFIPLLILGLYGVRLFGQGLLTHTSITSMARFFSANRGKAISLASLGHPGGEALLPIIVVTLIGFLGWRMALLVSAAFVLLAIPFVIRLLMRNKRFSHLRMFIPQLSTDSEDIKASKPLTILRSKAFWAIAPSNFASASIGTAIIFFQLKLGETRGWSPTWIAASFVAYAIGGALSTLIAGWLTDRFNGRVLFPIYLLPFSLGLIVLYFFDGEWVYTFLVAAIGITNGYGNTVKNSALAEIWGTKIIGSVRSLFTTTMVFSTALGPVVFGVLLDAGITFNQLVIGSLVLMLAISLNALRVMRL